MSRQLLITLLGAFVLRVVAQLIQWLGPVGFLPGFDSFQSGALPYPVLLVAQLAIIGVGLAVIGLGGPRPGRQPRPRWVLTVLSLFGTAYFIGMLFRGWLGLLERSDGGWFDEPLPTLFHLVLAAFVLVATHREWTEEQRQPGRSALAEMISVVIYPATISTGFLLYGALQASGVAIGIAAYLAVAIATVTILGAERLWPARPQWQPERNHLVNDVLFMAVVQVMLPAALALLATLTLDGLASGAGLQFDAIWPHQWPVAIQILLMLVIGDALRYWLHRASHQPNVLWRLHAVHHSPDRLYSLNVARFHPFDKALQYLLDALPFVILAVDRRVLLGYFVFYAVNGFFQHSNCHIRLGPLNWIVSGPELHRWHHSSIIAESDNNFGNNLIVWDAIFGTRFLPSDRRVTQLGLINRSYPDSFVGQMTSVFVPGLDKHPITTGRGAKPSNR